MMDMEQLLMQQFDSAVSTERVLHPLGDFLFMVDIDPNKMKIDKGVSDAGNPWARFSAIAHTQDADGKLQAETGRPPIMFVSIMLDLDDSGTQIALGKGQNVDLGQFLAACGINNANWSFAMIPGKYFKGRVGPSVNKKTGKPVVEFTAYTKP